MPEVGIAHSVTKRAARGAASGASGRRQATRDFDADLRRRRVAVMDQRVGLGRARERVERVRAGARRTEHDLARDAVEIDQRRRRLGHVADGEQDAAAFEPRQAVAEAAGVGEAIEFERKVARRDAAAAAARGHQRRRGSRAQTSALS